MSRAPNATNTVETMRPVSVQEAAYNDRWYTWIKQVETCFDNDGACDRNMLSNVLDEFKDHVRDIYCD